MCRHRHLQFLLRLFFAAFVSIFSMVFGYYAARSISPVQAFQAKAATISFSKGESHTFPQFAALVRKTTGVKLYADRRLKGREIFLSRGTYSVPELLEAVHTATGVPIRRVGEIQFFAKADPTFGGRLLFPVLPAAILDRVGKNLKPLALGLDLSKEEIPWALNEFLIGKTFPVAKLSAEQKAFILRHRTAPPLVLAATDNEAGTTANSDRKVGDLRATQVRLGTSYLVICAVSSPVTKLNKSDSRIYLKVRQVYYDYRSRLGITTTLSQD